MKPFASLSSGLLARKGAARPAMRRPDPLSAARIDSLTHGNAALSVPADDLGWNDMGYDVDPCAIEETVPVTAAISPANALSPMPAPARIGEAQDDHQDAAAPIAPVAVDLPLPEVAAIAAVLPPTPVNVAAAKGVPARQPRRPKAKAAFTLRLEAERHLRLRLACAVRHVSAQVLVTQALDALLATIPQLDTLADNARGDAANPN